MDPCSIFWVQVVPLEAIDYAALTLQVGIRTLSQGFDMPLWTRIYPGIALSRPYIIKKS